MTAYIVLVTVLLQNVSRNITCVVDVKKTSDAQKLRCIAIVVWDLGSVSNFITDAFARMNGVKGTEYHLNVITLGGVTTALTAIRYKCSLRDTNGKLDKFKHMAWIR